MTTRRGNSPAFLQPTYLMCPSVFLKKHACFWFFFAQWLQNILKVLPCWNMGFGTTWISVLKLWSLMFSFKINYFLPPLGWAPCASSATIPNSEFKGRSNNLLVVIHSDIFKAWEISQRRHHIFSMNEIDM